MPTPTDADILKTDLAGLALASPVILAAGASGVLDEMAGVLDLSRVGAVVTKSITPEPRAGNQTWRVWPVGEGMLNAIGLANPGVDRFVADYAPRARSMPCPVVGSVAGFAVEDYVRVATALAGSGALAAIELNVSCPNAHGGTQFGDDPVALRELVAAVRRACPGTKLWVKLSPITSGSPGIAAFATAAVGAGADVLTLANTVPAMAIDPDTRKPVLANTTGGLSGPAVRPITMKLVYDVHRALPHTPIVALGGVRTWRDAAEYILAGASAVAMGTTLFAAPRAPLKVASGLAKWARRQGAANLSELVGRIEV